MSLSIELTMFIKIYKNKTFLFCFPARADRPKNRLRLRSCLKNGDSATLPVIVLIILNVFWCVQAGPGVPARVPAQRCRVCRPPAVRQQRSEGRHFIT